MSLPPPPTGPIHTLRTHTFPISTLHISPHNERIYSADSSGLVVITSTKTLRPLASWQAHGDSVLGVEEFGFGGAEGKGRRVVTQARDNHLHIWSLLPILPLSSPNATIGHLNDSARITRTEEGKLPEPEKVYTMDVNALNFCRFSLLCLPSSVSLPSQLRKEGEGEEEPEALIAIPNLVDSEVADIWHLPTLDRIHAGVGQDGRRSNFWKTGLGEGEGEEGVSGEGGGGGGGRSGNGIIMSLHLYTLPISGPSLPSSSSSTLQSSLRLLTAYESGTLTLRHYVPSSNSASNSASDKEKSVEGKGWETIWSTRIHKESIMGMRVARDNSFALSISADHLIGKYVLNTNEPPSKTCTPFPGKSPGNGAVAIRDDGRVCAIAGWDGHIRLYTTKNMKPLGTLKYHKMGCSAVEFAHSAPGPSSGAGGEGREEGDAEGEEEEEDEEEENKKRWLVAGGKDHRVSIWELISFEKR